jgi:hypothetical protein
MTKVRNTSLHVVLFAEMPPDGASLLLVGKEPSFTRKSEPVLFANYGEAGTFVRCSDFDSKAFKEATQLRWHSVRELTVGAEDALLCTVNHGTPGEQWSYNNVRLDQIPYEGIWIFEFDKASGVIRRSPVPQRRSR